MAALSCPTSKSNSRTRKASSPESIWSSPPRTTGAATFRPRPRPDSHSTRRPRIPSQAIGILGRRVECESGLGLGLKVAAPVVLGGELQIDSGELAFRVLEFDLEVGHDNAAIDNPHAVGLSNFDFPFTVMPVLAQPREFFVDALL